MCNKESTHLFLTKDTTFDIHQAVNFFIDEIGYYSYEDSKDECQKIEKVLRDCRRKVKKERKERDNY